MKLYVLMRDINDDLGEGYSSSSVNEFITCKRTFDEARSSMMLMAYQYLEEKAWVIKEGRDFIEMEGTLLFHGYERLHIEEIEV